MARLIYAFLAFALGTLVAGFLIRDSSVPLFVSIGLSGLVLVMILFGTSRRLRRDTASVEMEPELAELEIVELDEEPSRAPVLPGDEEPTITVPKEPRPRPRTRAPAVRDEPQATEDEPTIVVPEPTAATRRRSRRPQPAAPAATIQIDMPDQARPRRKARASGRPSSSTDETAVVVPTPAPSPALTPKVWVIPGRSRYHAQSCRFAKGDQLREVTEATARRRGYVPCSVCQQPQASG